MEAGSGVLPIQIAAMSNVHLLTIEDKKGTGNPVPFFIFNNNENLPPHVQGFSHDPYRLAHIPDFPVEDEID